MDAVAIAVLVVAAGFAIGNWIAVGRGDRRLEFLCKPATLAALVVVALLLDPANDAQRWWFVAALAFSLLGDVLLMLPSDRFVAGLAAFLVAHLCYVPGLLLDRPGAVALGVAILVVAVTVGPLAVVVLRHVGASPTPELGTPVGLYIAVISAMVVSALASGDPRAAVGAVLFAGSDSMIAWNRFVRPFGGARVAIMVTYHLGQAGLVLSLLS